MEAPKVSSVAGMEEQEQALLESRLESTDAWRARQAVVRAMELACMARQAAEEEEEAAMGAKQEVARGAEQEEKEAAARGAEQEEKEEAAFGAEEAEAEMGEKARPEDIWVGKLRRSHLRYTPDSTLVPGSSRWGKAMAVLDTLRLVRKRGRAEELFAQLQSWPCARRVRRVGRSAGA